MPEQKASYILACFEHVQGLGGPRKAKARLLAASGRDTKIRFLRDFPGIGPKYARNIMMDVYHPEFRDSIAIDIRIAAISKALGLSFASYEDHEAFYLDVARVAGLNGWELDRLLFNFRGEVEARLRTSRKGHLNGMRVTSPTICAVTFEINAQRHTDGKFSVPRNVCWILRLRPRDEIDLIVEGPRGTQRYLKVLSSGTEVYGRDLRQHVRAGDRLRVTASRPR